MFWPHTEVGVSMQKTLHGRSIFGAQHQETTAAESGDGIQWVLHWTSGESVFQDAGGVVHV